MKERNGSNNYKDERDCEREEYGFYRGERDRMVEVRYVEDLKLSQWEGIA
jgi:hypothetical protein